MAFISDKLADGIMCTVSFPAVERHDDLPTDLVTEPPSAVTINRFRRL